MTQVIKHLPISNLQYYIKKKKKRHVMSLKNLKALGQVKEARHKILHPVRFYI
jgi:hypothetical protein